MQTVKQDMATAGQNQQSICVVIGFIPLKRSICEASTIRFMVI